MTSEVDTAPACWRCGGPCLQYAGSVHGWTCRACLRRHVEQSAARADAKAAKQRERLLTKAFQTNATNT